MSIDGSNRPRAARRTSVVASIVLAAMSSWADERPTTNPDPRVGGGLDDAVNPYSKLSDEQLDSLGKTFEDLDRDQRRWFLTEVRKRKSAKGEGPQIQVDRDEGFGRVVSKVAGTDQGPPPQSASPVGASPADEESAAATKVYGTGVQSQGEESKDVSTPALESEDPPEPSE